MGLTYFIVTAYMQVGNYCGSMNVLFWLGCVFKRAIMMRYGNSGMRMGETNALSVYVLDKYIGFLMMH